MVGPRTETLVNYYYRVSAKSKPLPHLLLANARLFYPAVYAREKRSVSTIAEREKERKLDSEDEALRYCNETYDIAMEVTRKNGKT